jgi:hypothetical protein
MILLRAAHGQPVINVARGPGYGTICTGMSPPDGGKTAGHRTDGAALWPAETQAPRYTYGVPGTVLFSQFTGRIRRPCWALNCGTRDRMSDLSAASDPRPSARQRRGGSMCGPLTRGGHTP